MAIKKPIPSNMIISGWQIEVFYRTQKRTCYRCGQDDHVASQCDTRYKYFENRFTMEEFPELVRKQPIVVEENVSEENEENENEESKMPESSEVVNEEENIEENVSEENEGNENEENKVPESSGEVVNEENDTQRSDETSTVKKHEIEEGTEVSDEVV